MSGGTTHLIQVKTNHVESTEDVAQDIQEQLSSFVVEAKPIEQGTVATGPREEPAQTLSAEPIQVIVNTNFKLLID